MPLNQEPGKWLTDLIVDWVNGSPDNNLQNAAGDRAFDRPLVGFAAGDAPIFEAYKDHVGPFHWTPAEAFAQAFPDAPASPGELSVIVWILPIAAQTKADNRKETFYPAERWARTRVYGEKMNKLLRIRVVEALTEQGIPAAAPDLLPEYKSMVSEKYGLASKWSHRHAAYAAGLGTFGLCDALITPAGKAMRVGSVVARVKIPPTPRLYDDHRAFCLLFAEGECDLCLKRCPVGAITPAGKDKAKCRAHVDGTTGYVKENFGFEGYACGLCQTGVPCESGIPVKRWREIYRLG